ncbi:thiamine pyrophosphate-dependent enzyme [Legionella sp.]|uniref:thiamine pyrophosphate-dependent enzyme n=1 Tax=Legionella sp. TaxID=459 RepID=UPI000CBD4967|nr:thiamine pyrophosphate-dependent enzyme [Legionella sp.]PJE05985.1 MAG: ubiquinone-dependent pyruvate dehydrogenase [Legionella sp.]
MALTTAEQMVELLKSAGIRRIYGVTGDSLNFLNDALRRDGSIEWIHVRHEEAGAFAAMAEGVLGSLGCCAGSSGPGHIHLLNGLYDAHRWGAPVLALASTIISQDYGSESFQSTDLSMFDGCSYYNEIAQTPKQLPRMLQQAMQYAWNSKGVGVCAFPGDLMMQKAYEQIPLATLYRPEAVICPSNNELQELASLINNSEQIGIYAGLGCTNARDEVLELAEKLKSPIAYTLKAKMVMEHENPHAVGMTGLLGSSAGARAITQCKLLLMLGSDFPWREFLDGEVKIVQIDTKPERLGRRVALYRGLTGDITSTIKALLPLIHVKNNDTFLNDCLKDYDVVQKNQHHHAKDPGQENLIKPEFLATKIDELADEDAIFTADTGMCTVWAARYIHSTGKRSLLGSFSHGSMANAMPQAIGAALHSPSRQVVALCGDGGISMLLGDLMTIAQYKLPIKLIVFNNRTLGMVELEMQVAGLPDWQTKMVNPDFAQVAEACGIRGYSIKNPDQLEQILREAFSYEGAVLVEVFTNPDVPVLPPHISLGVITRYVESEAKLAKAGRFKEAWLSLKTSIKYIRDFW